MLGSKIRDARKKARITQEELAQKIGVQRSVISKYETGTIDPTAGQLQSIADALEIDLLTLLGYDTAEKSTDAVNEVISQHQAILSTVLEDNRVPDDLKALIREELPTDPIAPLAALAFHAGKAEGKLKGIKAALNPVVFKLNPLLHQLNAKGQQVAVERVEELTKIPDYQKAETPADSD